MKQQLDDIIKRAQKVIDLTKKLEKKPRLLTDRERVKEKNREQPDTAPLKLREHDTPGDSGKMFSGTMTVTHEWSEKEINELIERHGYDPSKVTDNQRSMIAELLVWNLEDINEKTSYNDSLPDLLADVLG